MFTLEEVRNFAESGGLPAEKLAQLVDLIANRFQADVCSAYLLEPDRSSLVLAATRGLKPECVGHLRLHVTEGLAGLVAERVAPVAVQNARNHPRFKYFPEAGDRKSVV